MKDYPNTSIRCWAVEDRPREKALNKGHEALTDAELLAIIVGSGVSGGSTKRSAVELARELIDRYGGLPGLARASVRDLCRTRGIGPAKAIAITAAFELANRKTRAQARPCVRLSNSPSIANYLIPRLADHKQELFLVLFFNRNSEIIGEEILFTGGITSTVVDIKLILHKTLEHLATSIVVAHNHPSGNLTPSQADIDITRRLKRAAHSLEIRLSDHLIISHRGYYSFYESGTL
ncbi:MAG: DNA repair protein RadC [Bacteroidia bacterium]